MSLYDILKIDKRANREEIERAYKRLARQTHPTINKDKADDFIKINKAYEILKDKNKRGFYDIWGKASLKILENNDEAYIVTRCFDSFNLILYLFIFVTWILNIAVLPFLIYQGCFYLFSCLPGIIAGFMTSIPYIRARRAIGKLQQSSLHLQSMMYLFYRSVYISLYFLLPSLYFYVGGYKYFFICMITFLETVSFFIIHVYRQNSVNYLTFYSKEILRSFSILIVVNNILLDITNNIFKIISVCLLLIGLLSINNIKSEVKMGNYFFLLLYFGTFLCIYLKIQSLFIFIPVIIIDFFVLLIIYYSLKSFLKNMPTSRFRMYKEIEGV